MKLVFAPLSIIGGLIVGSLASKAFEAIWGVFDDEEPPDAKHRDVSLGKLVAALVVQGAISRLFRGLFDHTARRGFARATGTWPGEEAPQPE